MSGNGHRSPYIQSEREGAAFMSNGGAKFLIDDIVPVLLRCSRANISCDLCPEPDRSICIHKYDLRCEKRETTCPTCGETVIMRRHCSKCGGRIIYVWEGKRTLEQTTTGERGAQTSENKRLQYNPDSSAQLEKELCREA